MHRKRGVTAQLLIIVRASQVVVVRDADLMRFVFAVPPGEVRPKLSSFKHQVEESLPVLANLAIYDTVYYTDGNGAIDFSKTGSLIQSILEDICILHIKI